MAEGGWKQPTGQAFVSELPKEVARVTSAELDSPRSPARDGEAAFGSFPEWTPGAKTGRSLRACVGGAGDVSRRSSITPAGRRALRSGSLASVGDKSLCGVTAYHSAEEIKAALEGARGGARRRLEVVNESFGSSAMPCADNLTSSFSSGQGAGQRSSPTPEDAPLDEDVEILLDELQDRETQLLQAVELGAGLVKKLETEQLAAAEREAELQDAIDKLTGDLRKQTSEVRNLKTSVMFFANVEEELVGKTVENMILENEHKKLQARAAEGDTYRWLHGRYKEEGDQLDERERTQQEQEDEVKMKMRELNMWQARAARTDRVQAELDEANERGTELEREIRRLKKLVSERDSVVYGLKCQLRDRERAWEKENAEASVARLKREIARSRQVMNQHKETAAALREENRSLEMRLERMTAMASDVTLRQQQLVFSQQHAEQITAEITALKEECFDEMDMWMKAVTDVAKDNRCQGEVLRRLRNENTLLRDTIRMHENADLDRASGSVRSNIVSRCHVINKELSHVKDYARSVKSQAAVRQVTEKEMQVMSNDLSTLCKAFLALLQLLLSPAEKQRVGITLSSASTDTAYAAERLDSTSPQSRSLSPAYAMDGTSKSMSPPASSPRSNTKQRRSIPTQRSTSTRSPPPLRTAPSFSTSMSSSARSPPIGRRPSSKRVVA
eukprot:TRINITY_DN17100_c0_g1_i1.p1 TRINITY_DN17100_c0_g1~~TRINITY_DN17100_c0_g1_i1.p1  ORF type:complete len:675 (+),score=261.69 TRINITY_DN17100_c0_g1_i1:74-2098(+)